nr:pyridoxal phosphate-dependent aminotransferase [Haloquadratum walsbyi]
MSKTDQGMNEYDEPLFFQVMQYASNADRDIVDMVSGNPDWEPPDALRDGLHEYADADAADFQYGPSEGLTDLREQIGARRNIDSDNIIITHGAGEANYLAMAQAVECSDVNTPEFLLTDPVYPYYPGKASLLDATATHVPVHDDGHLNIDAIQDAASTDTVAIVLNTPNNPTGAVYNRAALNDVAAIAADIDALVIVDEVYDHFDFTGDFESALTLSSYTDRIIVTSAFSKSMAITGFRVGYAVFPPALVDAAQTRHMLVTVSGSRPAQRAVSDALEKTPPSYYASVRNTIRERIDTFTNALETIGAAYTEPEGAFYVMARFDDLPGTLENVEYLIDEAGVAGMPGEAFGNAYDDWIRFSLCTDRVSIAGDRLMTFFQDN